MSEIKALKKLRAAGRNMAKGRNLENHEECNLLLVIADEIEAEIAERFMELPCDLDGVPIRVGDVLRSAFSKTEYTALGFWFDFDCGVWQVMVSSKQAMSGNMLRHVKPRTLESVLADLTNEVWEASCTCQTTWSDSGLDGIEKRYADEIRELLGGGAE